MIWISTGLSLFCCALLWPAEQARRLEQDEWQGRRQELLAQGLPFKSRLLVAQTKANRLRQQIKILKELEKANQKFRAIKQEETLVTTVQVLLKANKSPLTTHLNSLSLSVLPTKLSTLNVKLNMPELLALAQSKRGSRYILFYLFKEIMADTSTIFCYPPLVEKLRKPKSAVAKKTNQILSSIEGNVPKRQVPPRLAEI